ncbi:hypothetical protein HS1genome_0776 [Sulfodiicoccus acidiphilus]|uniref:Polyketide cyclase n=1 Tax=Sulfodiicoccus acidiphilus TaxID=1670455 RepID=A0A348B2I5_9CREN|nr:hypothetical protein [Sulfodiicoccus acidiphilus]BBD72387.1 hypothetical protein HS1genome_0776 [Sulfodiicoccus acidiphilus]GGT97477.1 hypothetical protein GCM10007116_13790 [Sulfodiicoccus acidiphilus]
MITEERAVEVDVDRIALLKYLYDERNSPQLWAIVKEVQPIGEDEYTATVQLPGVPVPLAKVLVRKSLNVDGVIHEGHSNSPRLLLRLSVFLLGRRCVLRAEYEGPMEYFARRFLRNLLAGSAKKLEEVSRELART